MHRIDTSTAQKDKFGAGKDGFTSGNPQTGVPATEVSADILDAIQEEICSIIASAGLTLDKSKNNQMLDALLMTIYPVGAPIPWPTAVPPAGFLAMMGQSFSAVTHPKLALAYPDLVLPDMRAEFIRGWDAGRGGDLNRSILTNQSDLTKAHSHHISANAPTSYDEGWRLGAIRSDTYPAGRGIPATADTGASSFLPGPRGHSLGAIGIVGGVETRPRNIAFNYIVRAA